MENKGKNKNKKRLLILVALVGVMGIGGVVAATSITINSGVAISLGAGYTTATTCDAAVTITAGQGYDTGTNLYAVDQLNIADVDVNDIGGGCGNKNMQLAVVGSMANSPIQASWTLPSSSSTQYTFIFGTAANTPAVRLSGSNLYATATLTAFDIATLSTVALSIS
jgi:hypothetical protein